MFFFLSRLHFPVVVFIERVGDGGGGGGTESIESVPLVCRERVQNVCVWYDVCAGSEKKQKNTHTHTPCAKKSVCRFSFFFYSSLCVTLLLFSSRCFSFPFLPFFKLFSRRVINIHCEVCFAFLFTSSFILSTYIHLPIFLCFFWFVTAKKRNRWIRKQQPKKKNNTHALNGERVKERAITT